MRESRARYLLEKTKKDYTEISKEYSSTRKFFWRELYPLLQYIRKGDKVLDVGCGNGRLYPLVKQRGGEYWGVDNVEKFIEIAKKNWPQGRFLVADALNLPFKNEVFDIVFSVAVFHHIPSQEFRKLFLAQVRRVLKKKGILILTVWQLPFLKRLKLLLKFGFLKLLKREEIDFKDLFIPWGKKINRYVHQFSKKELKKLVEKQGFRVQRIGVLKKSKGGHSNIFVVAVRI